MTRKLVSSPPPSQPRLKRSNLLGSSSLSQCKSREAPSTLSNPPTKSSESPHPPDNSKTQIQHANNHHHPHVSPHQSSRKRPRNSPSLSLQSLPMKILLQIFRRLERDHLTLLFHSPSHKLKTAANLVLMERLALGISMYLETDPVDAGQMQRKIMLCGSVKGDSSGKRIAIERTTSENVNQKRIRERGVDVDRVKRRIVVCKDGRSVDVRRDGMKRGKNVDPDTLNQDEQGVRDDVGKISGKEDHNQATNRSYTTTTSPSSNTTNLPNELLFQILKPQTDKLLRSLLSLGPCQLRLVAETLLFERRQEVFRCGNRRSEYGFWPAISEKGQDYLGQRFILVNCGREGDREEGLSSSRGKRIEHLSLGSYWKVICEEVDFGRAIACS